MCRCEWVWDCKCVWLLEKKKILIGKLYLGASGDCAATVNDLSEKYIPQYTGGPCPGVIIEWPLRAWLLLTFPPVNKLSFFSSEEVDPFSSRIYTVGFKHGVRSRTESNSLKRGVTSLGLLVEKRCQPVTVLWLIIMIFSSLNWHPVSCWWINHNLK